MKSAAVHLMFLLSVVLRMHAVRPMARGQKASFHLENNPSYFNIGGVLSTNDSESHFSTTIAVRVQFAYARVESIMLLCHANLLE